MKFGASWEREYRRVYFAVTEISISDPDSGAGWDVVKDHVCTRFGRTGSGIGVIRSATSLSRFFSRGARGGNIFGRRRAR